MTHSIDDEAAERISVSTRSPEQPDLDPVPDEQEDSPVEAPRQRSQRAEAPVEHGTPAGQMALGAASVLTLGGLGLYQTVGVLGLVAGGGVAVAGGSGYAYWRFRKAYPRKDRQRDRAPRSSRSGRDLFGGSTSRSGRRAVFSAPGSSRAGRSSTGRSVGGRAGARMPSLGGGSTRGLAGGKRMAFPAGRGSARGAGRSRITGARPGRRAAAQTAAHAAAAPLRAARRAGRATKQRVAQAGRATRAYASPRLARARAASQRLDAATGHLASRAGRRVAQAARAVDQRAGGRLSRACRAVRPQRIRSLWQALRRLDSELTGDLAASTHPRVSAAWRRIRSLAERVGLIKPLPATLAQTPQPAPDPQPTPEPAPAAPEQPAPIRTFPVRAPSRTLARRHFRMSNGSPLVVVSADMIGSVSRYLPQDMWDVARDLDQLNQVPENVAMALRTYTTNLDTAYPIDGRVTQMMGEFYASIAKTSAMAQEIARGFRKIHADDIKRKEAPRAGEHFWNI
ncbi:hypothetical protein AB0J28_00785 [Streptosporangium canum]|uniref:hypothetical protein n=1 Tax=Streptosporangium canum TaxID=324952 RepID=UPI0034342735